MKKYLKKAAKIVLKVCFGWNKTVINAFFRNIKFDVSGNTSFDEVIIIKQLFKGRRRGILIDVGAHTGSFFENFLWKQWKIYAFEPDPAEFKQATLRDYEILKDVSIYNLAVSNVSGKVLPFYASEESTGISSLHSFTKDHKKITEVRTITLSDFINDQKIDRISILKIDTEGHDYFVLQGFPWDKFKPDFLMCEFEDRKTLPLGYDFVTVGNFLLNKGFKVFVSEWEPISKYGQIDKWISFNKYPCKLLNANGWGNFLCFNPDANLDYSILLKTNYN